MGSNYEEKHIISKMKTLDRKTFRQVITVFATFVLFVIALSSCEEGKNVKGKGGTSSKEIAQDKEITQEDENNSSTPPPTNNESSSSGASDTDNSLGKDSATSTSAVQKSKSNSDSTSTASASGTAAVAKAPLSQAKKKVVVMDKLKIALSTNPVSPFTKVCEIATNTYRSADSNSYKLHLWVGEIMEMYAYRKLWAKAIDNEYNHRPALADSNDFKIFKIKADNFKNRSENWRLEAVEQIGQIKRGTRKADKKTALLWNWDKLLKIMPKADKIWNELTKAADDVDAESK
jgi:hypothetical protein